jgi:hypothetical protein
LRYSVTFRSMRAVASASSYAAAGASVSRSTLQQ